MFPECRRAIRLDDREQQLPGGDVKRILPEDRLGNIGRNIGAFRRVSNLETHSGYGGSSGFPVAVS